MSMSPVTLLILEGAAASGIGSIIAALITARLSGPKKQAQAEPNGGRQRLQDEVAWLRNQLSIAQVRAAHMRKETDDPVD